MPGRAAFQLGLRVCGASEKREEDTASLRRRKAPFPIGEAAVGCEFSKRSMNAGSIKLPSPSARKSCERAAKILPFPSRLKSIEGK